MFRRPSLLNDIASMRNVSGYDTSCSTLTDNNGGADYTFDLDDIAIPATRPLTQGELAGLQDIIKESLTLTNCSCAIQAQEDAIDLVNFATELFLGSDDTTDASDADSNDESNDESDVTKDSSSKPLTVRSVLEELEDMELEICGPIAIEAMRKKLVHYLVKLHSIDGDGNRKPVGRASSMPDGSAAGGHCGHERRASLGTQLRNSDNHVASLHLDAKTAAKTKREELERLSGRGKSLKERMAMYDSKGGIRRSFVQHDDDELELDDYDAMPKDKASIDKGRQQDMEDVLNDVSLTEREQTDKMKEIRARYGLLEMKLRIAASKTSSALGNKEDATSAATGCGGVKGMPVLMRSKIPRAQRELKKGRRSSLDVSANAQVVKKAQELAVLKEGETASVKDRMAQYKDSMRKIEIEDGRESFLKEKDEKTIDDVRREELLAVMKDKTLTKEEKAKKMNEVRAKYPSAMDAAQQAASKNEQQASSALDPAEIEKQRRAELTAIMRNKSLKREEKKHQMDMVRWKYANNSKTPQPQDPQDDNTSVTSAETSSTISTKGSHENRNAKIDLSAKSYACRRRASLESLEESIMSIDSDDQNHVLSVRERMFVYANNEFVANA